MTANFTPRLLIHLREKIVPILYTVQLLSTWRDIAILVFYIFEHGYKYGKGQIPIDPCRYEHQLSVCLDRSPDSGSSTLKRDNWREAVIHHCARKLKLNAYHLSRHLSCKIMGGTVKSKLTKLYRTHTPRFF